MKKHLFYLCLLLSGLFVACGEDDNDNKIYQLQGTWTVQNKAVKVWPREGGHTEALALEDSLLQYTFLEENSEVIFHNDSVSLTISYMGFTQPGTYACSLRKNILSIVPPDNLPLILEGTVNLNSPILEFTFTTESYMTILQLLHPSFFDRILSANVSYVLQRNEL